MSFLISDAITRISNLPQPLWEPGITSGQQLQVINMALDRLWTYGEWSSLLMQTGPLTTTGGILTLPAQFRLLTGLQITASPPPSPGATGYGPARVTIKSQQWQFSPEAADIDWLEYLGPPWYAFDQGDDGMNRQYQIAGLPSYVDTLTFNGLAKLRYVYATTTNTVVLPDSFEGLLMAVRSLHSYDSGDTVRAGIEFDRALQIVEKDLGQVIQNEDMGRVTVEVEYSGGDILNLL